MTPAAFANAFAPVLRTAAGEPPLGTGGEFFRDDQGEIFHHDSPAYRSPATTIGILELSDGKWLAKPPSFHVARPQYDSREKALRTGIAAMLRRARKYMRNGEGQGTHWTEGYGGRVIEWVLSLKPEPAQAPVSRDVLAIIDQPVMASEVGIPTTEEINPPANAVNDLEAKQVSEEITDTTDWPDTLTHDMAAKELTIASYAASDAGAGLSDPVVKYLAEQHALRRQFPAKHNFSMMTDVENGRIVTVATCACKQVFRFGSNDHLRMNVAIEAHWSRFAHEKTVDGRGNPIGEAAPAEAKKPRKRKIKSSDGGVEGHAPEGSASVAVCGLQERRPRDMEAAGLQREAETGRSPEMARVREQVSNCVDQDSDRIAGPTAARGRAGIEPGPSEAVPPRDEYLEGIMNREPGAGGKTAPIEPAPSPLPEDGAGSAFDQDAQICAPAELPSGEAASPPRPQAEAGQAGEASASASLSAYLLAPADPATVKGANEDARSHAPPATISDDDDLAIEWPSYDAFLDGKIVTAPMRGIEVPRDALHPWLKPHCKDLTVWALRLGCAAIFANFGLHKTAMQLEWCRQLAKHTGQCTLNIVPLGVRHGFVKEALQLGMDVRFIRTTAELDDLYCEGVRHFLTNYESVRDGKLDPNQFEAVSLDEASVLRSYGSKTFQEFLPLFSKVPFKLVATATPSPNRYKELIHYAGFLGVMDTGLALTRWFQRNSEKAGDLTLYPHKEEEFWMWVHSWAAFLQRPSELGYSDEGYELPPLKLTWHEVPADHSKAEPERDGQGVMFRAVANSLQEAAKSRRDSLAPRITKMSEIIAQDPHSHRIIWHDLEAEREAIEQALPEVVTISGSMDIDDREVRLHDFEEGRTKYFGTKPILSGSGSNFQYHCHKAIYVALPGYGYKFNDFLQSLYRLQRFGQQHLVEVDIIYSEDERAGRAALEEKWARDIEMRAHMSEIILKYGLDTLPLRDRLARSIGVKRVEIKGERFTAINNDAVAEARTWPENSVDQIITSIPFSNHYEYSASYNDFGHTDDNGHFWGQMDFLTAELLRMLKPGRLACIHVKDRILFGSVTGEGVPTISPFHAEAIMHYRAHGFQYMGMITVVTDVVRENNQTYRLGWSENCKDGTKMGVGSPEYVLLLRKPQSDKTKGYADVPVGKEKGYTEVAAKRTWRFVMERNDAGELVYNEDGEANYIDTGVGEGSEPDSDGPFVEPLDLRPAEAKGYSRARWQIDAHAFWRSSGNRMLTPEEFAACSSADLAKLFAKTTVERVYDYEAHVKIGETHEKTGTLPATFMAIAPGSHDPDVWHDVNRMRTLNMLQQRKGAEMHLCPLQFDIVDRLIERYSNEGELIFDPFGGLMTVPYRALLKNRRGAATELNAGYFLDGVHYLRMAEEKMTTPALFDLAGFDAADTPPRK
jgi:hypothetical protein